MVDVGLVTNVDGRGVDKMHEHLEDRDKYKQFYENQFDNPEEQRVFTHWTEKNGEERLLEKHICWTHRFRLEFLFERLVHKPFDECLDVLDAGCGLGLFTMMLAPMGFKVTAMDVSKERIDWAKSSVCQCVDWQVGFIEDVAELGKQYDAIVCFRARYGP
jgi:2-polyprenyl-3-methyl-5-hydroxy-6-metoxy-1,4-benzoquinol methylase